jgi:uncharacterized membrane protein YGL010W
MNLLQNWLDRHQNPASLLLHAIGIPAVCASVVLLIVSAFREIESLSMWFWGLFLVGYLLQFIGHAIEWTEPGEFILIRKIVGGIISVAKPQGENADRPDKP